MIRSAYSDGDRPIGPATRSAALAGRCAVRAVALLTIAGAVVAPDAHAQGSRRNRAPAFPRGMFGQPLYQPHMPQGTATIKVIGSAMAEIKKGVPVELHRRDSDGGQTKLKESRTGDDGRARFENLAPTVTYVAIATVGERRLSSAPFSGPKSGGVRLMLSTLQGQPEDKPRTKSAPAPAGRHGTTTEAAASSSDRSGAAKLAKDATLPAGTVEVKVVRGTAKEPLAGALIAHDVDRARNFGRTDDSGVYRIAMAEGASTVKLVVSHSGLNYRSQPIPRPTAGGVPRHPSRSTIAPPRPACCASARAATCWRASERNASASAR